MPGSKGLILLDRDGVLNRIVIDPEQGTIDSPLHPDQVEVYPWVARSLARLTQSGWALAIVTNQPSWAKGKTTRENLDAAHRKVVAEAEREGGMIWNSQICLHRSEDLCTCRKPAIGMLEAALNACAPRADFDKSRIWMVGDGVTDVQAGVAFGVKTGFLGPRKCDACKIFEDAGLQPAFWGKNLEEFTDHVLGASASESVRGRCC